MIADLYANHDDNDKELDKNMTTKQDQWIYF